MFVYRMNPSTPLIPARKTFLCFSEDPPIAVLFAVEDDVANMGNSWIGRSFDCSIINNLPRSFRTITKRLDSDLDKTEIDKIRLAKMDVQGFEGHLIEGMGKQLDDKIDAIKFEYAPRLLEEDQGCKELVPKLKEYEFRVYQ